VPPKNVGGTGENAFLKGTIGRESEKNQKNALLSGSSRRRVASGKKDDDGARTLSFITKKRGPPAEDP